MAGEQIQDPQEYSDDPEGQARLWRVELDAARKALGDWQKAGKRICSRFLDKRSKGSEGDGVDQRLNYFTANVQTQAAMLVGQIPKATVSRRFADAKDDVARVAGEVLERVLNSDIERSGDGFYRGMRMITLDRLLPGLGVLRLRYDTGPISVEDVPPILGEPDPTTGEPTVLAEGYQQETRPGEDAVVEYAHWRDQLFSPAKIFSEVRWWAFRAEMRREDLVKRFGDIGKLVPLNAKKLGEEREAQSSDTKAAEPWARADVWEIWDREHSKVIWYVDGFSKTLDSKDDPLELDGFWPFEEPLMANLTNEEYVPRADFSLAEDLYDEIDDLSVRIALIQGALKVAGVYDKNAGEDVGRLINEASGNELIPVDGWAAFQERGGIKGSIEWLPVEQLVLVLGQLREQRSGAVETLYQLTGMSDILRGQAQGPEATATEQTLKARFASVRLQRLQDEIAHYASGTQRRRAAIICKFFEPANIIERSNAMQLHDDPQLVQKAVDFLKENHYQYRIEVKPESVSLTDFAQLKAERFEVLDTIGKFLTTAAPLAQSMPGASVFLLELLQCAVAGLRGSSAMEGILDRAITAAQQAQRQAAANPHPQQPDPKLMAAQVKGQIDQQKEAQKLQADLVRIRAETEANAERQRDQAHYNLLEMQGRERVKQQAQVPQVPGGAPG